MKDSWGLYVINNGLTAGAMFAIWSFSQLQTGDAGGNSWHKWEPVYWQRHWPVREKISKSMYRSPSLCDLRKSGKKSTEVLMNTWPWQQNKQWNMRFSAPGSQIFQCVWGWNSGGCQKTLNRNKTVRVSAPTVWWNTSTLHKHFI